MEDNNDMPSVSTLESQPIGETGGDSNDIMPGDCSKSAVQNKVPLSFFSPPGTHS